MPSPFPGMNPYLEQDDVWQDFHQTFLTAARELLREQVRSDYLVKVEEHIYIHELSAEERLFLGRADVSVARRAGTATVPGAAPVITAPMHARLPVAIDVVRQPFLEVRDRCDRQLITVLELLSPANKKPGSDREQYLAKRRQLLASSVHLVELDLLRGAHRLPMQDLPSCDYYALVSPAENRPEVGVWPLHLRDPLPVVPVPLHAPHPPAWLDLRRLLDRVYDAAGYEDYIYQGTPQPPLAPDDAAWAAQFVPAGPS